ncbi:PA2779 family protein [Cognatazoarcus halotolerans]|uniref:PA2779 family protein n=1 Tax=Cognatazoarcus halotolerans TaxID=2686016 RepID=UPI001357DEA9|nr:PA2779 family protein [Cognatazoarcus halotolerans]MBX3678698.1 PA2779 family protein [Rhodocyclaceae bacterium]MCB1899483.1 PA2779 family protein [Rhodocyclaceae bacterium]MCP5309421.1 PA2779 family protein [Zoogloeaceae bacterium]
MLKRTAHLYIAFSIAITGFAQSASAALVGAEDVARAQVEQPASRDAHARLQELLARPDVQAELVRQGVDPALAAERAASLSAEDAQKLAANMDSAPAGGDVLGAILLVFFVLLLTDILGFTKIFPFTRSVR